MYKLRLISAQVHGDDVLGDARLAGAARLCDRLRQATKRELKRKLAAAENVAALWEAHRESVQQLALSQEGGGAVAALDGTQRLNETLQQGWQLLKTTNDGAAAGVTGSSGEVPPTTQAPGPRGLQQRFAQRRGEIATVSVPDLGLLSSLLCAS